MRNEIAISGSLQSPGSASASLAYDKNLQTIWRTTGDATPDSAFAMFDLNMVQRIGEIAWQFSEPSTGAPLRIEGAVTPAAWQPIATPGDAPADAWQSLTCDASARFVRFTFDNPNGLPVLGNLREVQIFGK